MKFVAFICLYIAILFQQIQHLESISCFQCSLLGTDQIECPSKNEDISKWIDLKDKYVLKSNSKSFSCLVGVDKTLKVYYQGGFDIVQCNSPELQQRIKIQINIKSPVKSSQLQCCSQDGCNWNLTTAVSDLSITQVIENSGTSTLVASVWVPIVLLIVLLIISAIIFIGGLFCIRAKQSGEDTYICLFCCKNHQNEDKVDEKEQVDSKPATTTNQQPKTKTSTSPKKTKYFNFRIRAMTPNTTTTNQSQESQHHQPVMTAKPKPEWLGPKQSRRNGGRRVSIPFGRHAQARERKMGQRGKKSQAWVKSPERVLKKVSTKAMAAKDIAMALKEAFIAFEAYESYEVEENGERS